MCQVCLHLTIGEKLNLEVKKISSDSESNSFANLSRISDEDIKARSKIRKMLKNL